MALRSKTVAVVAIAVGSLAAVGVWHARSGRSGSPGAITAVAEPALRQLTGDLAAGDTVAGWTVHGFGGARDRVARIEVTRGDTYFCVFISARSQPGAHQPPIETERYAIGFGEVRGRGAAPDDGTMLSVASAIAARVREHEATSPVPTGLAPGP